MLPALLWLVAAIGVAALTGIRAQIVILSRLPDAAWLASVGGLLSAGLVLSVALATVFTCRSLRRTGALFAGLPLATALLGLMALTSAPPGVFKSPQVADEWRLLHPALRSAAWTLIAVDGHIVLTDIARTADSYANIGLPEAKESQHYVDSSGYARAMDLRVRDAGPLRNWLRQGALMAMGLKALRHRGTADHLHVSLPGGQE